MVDDDTFLTAAHCTDDWPDGTRFFVSLAQDIQTPLDDAVAAGLTAPEAATELLDDGVIVEGDAHQDAGYPGPASDAHDIGVSTSLTGGDPRRRLDLHACHAADRGSAGRHRPRALIVVQLAGRRLWHRGGPPPARRPGASGRRHPAQGERGLHRAEQGVGSSRHARVPRLRRRRATGTPAVRTS